MERNTAGRAEEKPGASATEREKYAGLSLGRSPYVLESLPARPTPLTYPRFHLPYEQVLRMQPAPPAEVEEELFCPNRALDLPRRANLQIDWGPRRKSELVCLVEA